jgi:hypothetical protein
MPAVTKLRAGWLLALCKLQQSYIVENHASVLRFI